MKAATDGSAVADPHAGLAAPGQQPSISGGVLCSYRASLASCGMWAAAQAGFAARSGLPASWLDEVRPGDWFSLDRFLALLEALAEGLEPELLRTLVRRRMAEPGGSNFYAPMLRSWARSFGGSPEQMLRGLLPLWRAALRHTGAPEVLWVAQGEVHVLLGGSFARAVRSCEPLSVSFEGVLLGLLDLATPRPLGDVELQRAPAGVRAVCRF